MSVIKDATDRIKSKADEVKRLVIDLFESLPKPIANRPTLILRETIIKRIMDRRIERVREKYGSQGS